MEEHENSIRRWNVSSVEVTDFRIDRCLIPEEAFFALPTKARDLLRAYWTYIVTTPEGIPFELPAYRWDEILPECGDAEGLGSLMQLHGGNSVRTGDV